MGSNRHIEVSAPARLHFGLLDCGNASQLLFGGVGAAIDGFRTDIGATPSFSGEWEIISRDSGRSLLSKREESELHDMLGRATELGATACQLTIYSKAPEHMGLGSKTSLLLTAARAALYYSLDSREHELDRDLITEVTGRGGTSGIGINTFWDGKLIWDTGHPVPRGERDFLPSSRRHAELLPVKNAEVALGPEYSVALFYDPASSRVEGSREVNIFEQHMPFPDNEIYRAITAAYQDLLGGFRHHEMGIVAHALRELNGVSMKAKEVELQTAGTRAWLESAWAEGLPAGLSSFGPTVFCFEREDLPKLASRSRELAAARGLHSLGSFQIDNQGSRLDDINLALDMMDADRRGELLCKPVASHSEPSITRLSASRGRRIGRAVRITSTAEEETATNAARAST